MTADIDIDTNTDSAAPPSEHRHVGAYVEMLISSLIGLVASLILSIEAITLATNPAAVLSCDISSKISCGVVAQTWQAQLFGWPNSFLGLIAEPVVITVAVAALGGVRFPRWFMLTAVSYTHLDVYKRQSPGSSSVVEINGSPSSPTRACTTSLSGIRTPTVFFFGCMSRRGTSFVAGRMKV